MFCKTEQLKIKQIVTSLLPLTIFINPNFYWSWKVEKISQLLHFLCSPCVSFLFIQLNNIYLDEKFNNSKTSIKLFLYYYITFYIIHRIFIVYEFCILLDLQHTLNEYLIQVTMND